MSDFPIVPVALVVVALGGLFYLGTRPSKSAEPEDRSKIPVGGGAGPFDSITAGTVFVADLSGTAVWRDPATAAPGSSFTALGPVDRETGAHQGGPAFVRARHNGTNEVVDVPLERIKSAGGAGTGQMYSRAYYPALYAG